jgi:hypothetical protein
MVFSGHLDVWLTNQEQQLLERTKHLVPDSAMLLGWVNGDLYTPAGETVGIHPIPDSIRAMADMQSFNPAVTDDSLKHKFLAKQQAARYAVISVHTIEEKLLFKKLMQERVDLQQGASTPDWKQVAQLWNQTANGKTIFYKVRITNRLSCVTLNLFFPAS